MSHTGRSHGENERGKQGDEVLKEMKKGGWERLNKQLALSKLRTAHVSMTATREGRSWQASEATPNRGLSCAPIH